MCSSDFLLPVAFKIRIFLFVVRFHETGKISGKNTCTKNPFILQYF